MKNKRIGKKSKAIVFFLIIFLLASGWRINMDAYGDSITVNTNKIESTSPFQITLMPAGVGTNALIKNIGNETKYYVNHNMTCEILLGIFPIIEKKAIGYFEHIYPGEVVRLSGRPLMGFGKLKVTLTVYTSEEDKATASGKRNVFWWFVFPSFT